MEHGPMYHGTHIRNVPSILYEGQLRPSARSNLHLGDTPEGCHFSSEFEVAREFATRSRLHLLNADEVTNIHTDYPRIVREADEALQEFTQVVFKAYALSPPDVTWEIDSSMKTWIDPTRIRLWQMFVIVGSPMHQQAKVGDYRIYTTRSPDGGRSFQVSKHKCHREYPDPRKLLHPMRPWVPVGFFHAPR